MNGLHLTGDLFDCSCSAALLTDLETLSKTCRDATNESKLTIVDQAWHRFPEWNGEPGGITGTILLAESHLAIHTWPERSGVTLDVYVCNFTDDNTGRAEQLFEALTLAFRPKSQSVNRITRGDLAAGTANADGQSRKGRIDFRLAECAFGLRHDSYQNAGANPVTVSKSRGLRHTAVRQTFSARRTHDDLRS